MRGISLALRIVKAVTRFSNGKKEIRAPRNFERCFGALYYLGKSRRQNPTPVVVSFLPVVYRMERKNMKMLKPYSMLLALLMVIGTLAGCSSTAKSPDVADNIRKSLDEANLKNVSVKQDRDKGVVTLGGNVATESDKSRAESIAKSVAGGQVVADEIAVIPPGGESEAKAMHSRLAKGSSNNLVAALLPTKRCTAREHESREG